MQMKFHTEIPRPQDYYPNSHTLKEKDYRLNSLNIVTSSNNKITIKNTQGQVNTRLPPHKCKFTY